MSGASVTTAEDTPVTFPITATDPELDPVTVSAATAEHGTVSIIGTMVTYTPAANFNGSDGVLVTVSDGLESSTATIDVTVTPVNDPPTGRADSFAAAEDTELTVALSTLLANDMDVDGDTLTVVSVGNPNNGAVVLDAANARFTPALDFSGPAGFEYVVSDGQTAVTVAVAVAVALANDAPVATNDAVNATEDTAATIAAATLLSNDTDPEGQTLMITAVANPTNGTVALTGTTITFTPNGDFNGSASFEYTLSDGAGTDTGVVTLAVAAVNDAPVAVDDTGPTVSAGIPALISVEDLIGNDTDIDGPGLAIASVQNAVGGTVMLGNAMVAFTATAGTTGTATFDYTLSDGTLTDVGTVTLTVVLPTICGDSMVVPPEQCDDGNLIDEDGCTSLCVVGALCNALALPGGDRFEVNPSSGHCYASFDDDQQTFTAAQAACVGAGGYLATITSAAEDVFVLAAHNTAQNPWIGARDDANDTDTIFDWVTDEAFGYTHYAANQPDDDMGTGGNGECLHLMNAAGEWNDTNCDITTFVVGRICEVEPVPCGDSVTQPSEGEECDDGNTASGDNCSATCQVEAGCGDGDVDAGEECDDDNTTSGDGCSAACIAELISISIAPAPVTISQQQRVQLRATGTFFGGATSDVTATAVWTSGDASIATVASGGATNGRVDALLVAGAVTISATVGTITGNASVTVDATACTMRVNEVQVVGDGASPNADEFTELFNPCTVAIDMTGWSLVYRSAAGTTDINATTVNLSGTVQPGEFRLYVGFGYNGTETVDGTFGSSATGSYAAAGGGVAIRAGAQDVGPILDRVGWGNATNLFVDGTTAAAPPANRSIGRSVFDGRDTNVNSADFVLTNAGGTPPTLPTPRAANNL